MSDDRSPIDPEVVDLICASMRANPEQWEVSAYTATSQTMGVEVWHCSGYFAISYKMFGQTFGPYMMMGWIFPSRRKLYRAAKALYRAKFVDPVDQKVRAWKFRQWQQAAESSSRA